MPTYRRLLVRPMTVDRRAESPASWVLILAGPVDARGHRMAITDIAADTRLNAAHIIVSRA